MIKGINTSELFISSQLFQHANYSKISYWKVDLWINNAGRSSLIFKINETPKNGFCAIDKYNGTSMDTYFQIICSNWIDLDGKITRYEYFGKFISLLYLKL